MDIARGNPLLNSQDFNLKRRWDDDVVFKNQARGTEKKEGKEFVNVRCYELAQGSCHTNLFLPQIRTCYVPTFTKDSWYVLHLYP